MFFGWWLICWIFSLWYFIGDVSLSGASNYPHIYTRVTHWHTTYKYKATVVGVLSVSWSLSILTRSIESLKNVIHFHVYRHIVQKCVKPFRLGRYICDGMYQENPAQRAWNFNHLHIRIISGDRSFSGLTLNVAVRLILTDSDFIYQWINQLLCIENNSLIKQRVLFRQFLVNFQICVL